MIKILLVGGGTLGPVMPLLAIAEAAAKRSDMKIVGFVGTPGGLEKIFAKRASLRFFGIQAGKFRRYWDVRNLVAPLLTLVGFFEALILLLRLRPNVIVSGGAFVGVPVLLAARVLRVRAVAHQQDVLPSLANKLAASFVDRITVTFPETAAAFPKEKVTITGNPVRPSILAGDRGRAVDNFELSPKLPTLFVFGGGSGAAALNKILVDALPKLAEFCQVLHATGKHKLRTTYYVLRTPDRYHAIELFADTMPDAYAAADLVLGRAGIGTISELSALGKPAIIVPIPGSHQEANAAFLEAKHAAVVIHQRELTSGRLVEIVRALLPDNTLRRELGERIAEVNPRDALNRMLAVLRE